MGASSIGRRVSSPVEGAIFARSARIRRALKKGQSPSPHQDGVRSRPSAPRWFRLDLPPTPPPAPKVEGRLLRFSWTGQPGQAFDLQLAADPRFEHIVEARRIDRPAADVPVPLHGTYYARLRAIDADGYVGPYTGATRIEISANTPQSSCLVPGDRGLCAVYAPAPAPPR